MEKPQIILHLHKPVNYTLFDAKWIPCSAKFVALGNYARGTGALQIYEVSHGDVNVIKDVCKTFTADRKNVDLITVSEISRPQK